MPTSQRRRILGTPVLLATGCAAALLIGECFARLAGYQPLVTTPPYLFDNDPVTWWTLRAGFRRRVAQPDGDVTYAINSQGIRAAREIGPKTPGTLRVFVLGDSFAFGWGVEEPDALAAQLEAILTARGRAAEVVNLGVPGFGTTQVRGRLFQMTERLGVPDAAVYLFCPNDPVDSVAGRKVVVDGVRIDVERRPKRLLALLARAYEHSRLLAWILDTAYTRANPRSAKASALRGAGTPVAERADFLAAGRALDAMLDWAEAHRVGFLVATTTHSEYSEPLRERLQRRGVELLEFDDLLHARGLRAEALTLPHDGHWNRTGHALMAETLAARLWP